MKPIPIVAARNVAEQYGYDQVVIIARKVGDDGGRCNFISNGADRADLAVLFREMAARFEGMPEIKGGRA